MVFQQCDYGSCEGECGAVVTLSGVDGLAYVVLAVKIGVEVNAAAVEITSEASTTARSIQPKRFCASAWQHLAIHGRVYRVGFYIVFHSCGCESS
jgi:hypothetical protein